MSLLSEVYSSGREGAAGKETWRRGRGKKKKERRARARAAAGHPPPDSHTDEELAGVLQPRGQCLGWLAAAAGRCSRSIEMMCHHSICI